MTSGRPEFNYGDHFINQAAIVRATMDRDAMVHTRQSGLDLVVTRYLSLQRLPGI